MEDFSEDQGSNAKVVSIVTYFTFVGLIIAIVLNGSQRTELGSFHIRQSLGIILTTFVIGFIFVIPFLGWVIGAVGYLAMFVLWIMGLVSAINGTMKPVPILGEQYQEWFKSL